MQRQSRGNRCSTNKTKATCKDYESEIEMSYEKHYLDSRNHTRRHKFEFRERKNL
jgi:hypothetical protein